MNELNLNGLSPAEFLTTYWQKKPVVIKQGFSNFVDPISPDELAGLAMEEDVESRFIHLESDKSTVRNGPFEDFSDFPATHWTLLVQATDHWDEQAAKLIDPFRFIPNWRLDDLMVSYSAPEGGVGPHLDQYDVFIIQGMGKRRWTVGEKITKPVRDERHADLDLIHPFEPIIDEVLEPGDIIYIPPGFPHDGITIEPCLNYSVGHRAPDQQALFSGFADYLIDQEVVGERYSDPTLTPALSPGLLSPAALKDLKQMMHQAIDSSHFNNWIGSYLSEAKHDMNIIEPDEPWDIDELLQDIQCDNDVWFIRAGGLRTLYIETDDGTLSLFINGERLSFDQQYLPFITLLTDNTRIHNTALQPWAEDQQVLNTLIALINQGYWYVE